MTQSDRWTSAVIANRQSMESIGTDVVRDLKRIANIRAVIFDIYGTLVISGSGDVGSADSGGKDDRIAEAFAALGLQLETLPGVAELHDQIQQLNNDRRTENCPFPEVDIVDAWRGILRRRQYDPDPQIVVEVAAEYESRANPTWPMPGARELLATLQRAEMPLGIVSNAQIFTIPLVKDLTVSGALAAGGFDLDLCVFSNRFRQAKPGPRLFEVLCDGLNRRGIEPDQAIYVGNDMLNDVWAASRAGLKTAWFAGDRRSCRPRPDDPRCHDLVPNLILTELMQLPECLELK